MKKIIQSVLCIVFPVMLISANERQVFSYGEKLLQEGLYDAAMLQFEDFVNQYPGSPNAARATFYMAECGIEQKKYEQAIEKLLILFYQYSDYPQMPAAQIHLAACYEALNEHEKAVNVYLRVFEYYPDSPDAKKGLENAARLAFELKQLQRAEKIYSTLLNQTISSQKRIEIMFSLVDVLTAENKMEAASRYIGEMDRMTLTGKQTILRLQKGAAIARGSGQWLAALQQLEKTRPLGADPAAAAAIEMEMVHLSRLLGQGERVQTALQNVIKTCSDSGMVCRAWLTLGDYQLENKDFELALAAFEQAVKMAASEEQHQRALYGQGKAAVKASEFERGIDAFNLLFKSLTAQDDLYAAAVLAHASGLADAKQYDASVQEYLNYARHFTDDALLPYVYRRIASLSQKNMALSNQAEFYLREILLRFPGHSMIPEVYYEYGQLLLNRGRFQEALTAFEKLNSIYPGNGNHQTIGRLQKNLSVILTLQTRLSRSAIAGQQKMLLDLGFFNLQQNNGVLAMDYFERLLENAAPEMRDDVTWLLIQCYEFNLLTGKNSLSEVQESYWPLLKQIASQSPKADRRFDAELLLMEQMESNVTILSDMLTRYTDAVQVATVCRLIGEAHRQTGQYERAAQFFQDALRHHSQNTDALAALAVIYENRGQAADSLYLSALKADSGNQNSPEITYRLGLAYLRSNQNREALTRFRKVHQHFFYSPFADSARVRISQIHARENHGTQAIAFLKELLSRDSIRVDACRHGLLKFSTSQRPKYLLALAELYQSQKKWALARDTYLAYGAEMRDEQAYRLMIARLAEIAEAEGKMEQAAGYLNVLNANKPEERIFAQIGDLTYRLKKYDDAIEAYDQAFALAAAPESGASYLANIISSYHKKGQIPQANVCIQTFEKRFAKIKGYKTYQARFFVERGDAQLARKNFQLAEEAYRKALKTKDKTWTPEAEFGIGKILLVTNKTEKALKKLTDMIHDYPDHKVLGRVYLNLGDYYFRNQHYNNALQAFHKVIDTYPDPEILPSAMRYLLRVYEGLRFWDAALSLAKEYIETFPRADDVMTKQIQIGSFLMNLKEYQRAVAHFESIHPFADADSDAEIQYWLGKAYAEMGLFNRAILEYLKVKYVSRPNKMPWASTALYESGLLYARMDKTDEAIQLLDKIVKVEGAASDLGRIAKKKINELQGESI